MKRSSASLPLGIDIGASRVRVALAHRRADGRPELAAVAVRDRDGDLAATIADAVDELRTRERRCVASVGEPAGVLRTTTFPPMRRAELERAARFEAIRLIDYPIDEAHVRIVSLDAPTGEIAIGIVRKATLAMVRSAVEGAKLRLIAVDNDAFALARAIAGTDAILDIGRTESRLHIFTDRVPRTYRLRIGGSTFTQAIADALGTDPVTAERRKLAHGVAGSGEDVCDRLVESIANALVDSRANGYGDVRSIALTGNGARLDDLANRIERATAVRVCVATLAPDASAVLPPDVLRAAAPDWCHAFGLALWSVA